MSKAYITAPYTEKSVIKDKSHVYGEINDISFKNFLESIELTVKTCGFSTFLPHRDIHHWGTPYIEPSIVYQKVLEEIKNSDVLIAYPGYSKGSNVDIGIAAILGKKIIILLSKTDESSLTYLGLNALTDTRIVRFNDISDLKSKLKDILISSFNLKNL